MRYKFSPKNEVYFKTGLIQLHFVTKLKLDTVLSFADFFRKLKDDSNFLCYPTVCALKSMRCCHVVRQGNLAIASIVACLGVSTSTTTMPTTAKTPTTFIT